ncbi:M28 family metallopeptidase [Thermocrispum municipale]|uniref:M28 family metallopeptidase n=1 Tax=Thermocrispum municipale TaxID=37926 RepID=UPI000406F8E6|nr:M28 family metallopeptidase [Thermocrispum municipale]
MPSVRRKLAAATAVAAGAALVLSTPGAVAAPQADNNLPKKLVQAVNPDKVQKHLIAFQRYADQNEGHRAAGTEGHAKSAEYVASKLEAAGFNVTRQEFPFVYDETTAESLTLGGEEIDAIRMSYSPNTPEGGVTAELFAIPVDDTPGCEASDFPAEAEGKIVLIQRGVCTFGEKQAAAGEAGAAAAIIYNNTEGALNGTLGDPEIAAVPTAGVTQEDGAKLVEAAGQEATLDLQGITEDRTSVNVIAETKTGRHDNVVMAGAHLDGVAAGPGINDNGSGSAALLTTALELGGSPKVNNAVRFAWWSAEELGLVGAEHYVSQLSEAEQFDIALYLNFDMIASPNAAYFAYDGDDSDGEGAPEGPYGSADIEKKFVNFIENKRGIQVEGTDFDGRSDYGPFIEVGIPSGGLFTGAEGIKTEEQAENWGGEAGVAYDPCYHAKCDNLGNINRKALNVNSDAMAWVIGKYALSTKSVNGVKPNAAKSKAAIAKQRANTARSLPMVANENAHDHAAVK